jgi:hypothetical protein
MGLAKPKNNCNRKFNGGSMKKLIVSMMLIISMFAFAAESDPSATVGYVKYDLVAPSTGFNVIALPVNEGYSSSAQVGDAIANCNFISYYDAANQFWRVSDPDPFFGGWLNPFVVQTGMGLQVGVTAASSFINDGPVVDIPAYNLVAPSTGFNVIMHPLTHSSMTTSAQIGDDISNCNFISYYDAANQFWRVSDPDPFFGGWLNPFATEIGEGLQVGVTAASTWPSAKSYDVVEGEAHTSPKGISKSVYYHAQDASGNEFDFSAAPYDNVTFKVWVVGREAELFTQESPPCGYTVLGGTMSAVNVQVGAFPTDWAPGDVVRFWVKQEVDPLDHTTWYEGVGDTAPLVNDGAAQFNGWNGAPGTATPPILTASNPSSVDEIVPTSTKLHQNYPNPFNPNTTIRFDLASSEVVKVNVYNYNGQLMNTLANGRMNAGQHTVNFDASNLSAGVYYYTLETENSVQTNKMILVK